MPETEKQRKAGFAELANRKKGKKAKMFEGLGDNALKKYLKEPLHKKKGKGKKMTAGEQASALRQDKY